MKKVLILIVSIILVAITILGLLFYIAYDRGASRLFYEGIEVRVDCEDYRLASIEEWKIMNFEINDNIATKGNINYNINTQKICMDFGKYTAICTETCENKGYSFSGWEVDNQAGQHVCKCQ
ncbi:MAG: hypothetical protein Q8R37_01125 [Nanoarchaeota archaeon]|nr:hypothetical protein [Nanoarchaeota archaeon]